MTCTTISKAISLLMLLMVFGSPAGAQLSGTYTIGGTSPNYTTLSAAISDLNSNGVNGPVQFLIRDGNYSGSSWIGSINNVPGLSSTNTVTFRSQSGNRANVVISDNSSSNYIFRFNGARYISVEDMTLTKNSTSFGRVFDFVGQSSNIFVDNCVLQASASTSSSNAMALVHASGHTGSDNTISNCSFINGGTFVYWWGSSTTATSNGISFINNNFSATNSGYWGVYTYYTRDLAFEGNTCNRTGTGVYYSINMYYNADNFTFTNNTINASSTSTLYYRLYYLNYLNVNTTADVEISDNDIALTNTTGTSYCYTAFMRHAHIQGNSVSMNSTSGSKYVYNAYYFFESEVEDNSFMLSSTTGGVNYYYDLWYGDKSESHDNILQIQARSTTYVYTVMYGTNSEMYDNTITVNNTTGATYFYGGYRSSGSKLYNCAFTGNSTSGWIYGLRCGYDAGQVYNNKLAFTSTNGGVYGLYIDWMNAGKVFNNEVYIRTAGMAYNMYTWYCTGGEVENNTLHNDGTGTTGYLLYDYSRNPGNFIMKNNIYSRRTGGGDMVYTYSATNSKSDYNLFYSPGTAEYQSVTGPTATVNNLHAWRDLSGGRDRSSLFYEPPYVDAANRDLRINANSSAAWAVNGRAEHDTTIKEDITGATRPYLREDGVPDIGAYEVTPVATPPDALPIPATPVPNTSQYFLFAQDTVMSVDWGPSVPTDLSVRQYSGLQAGPIPAGVGKMYFYTACTPSSWLHNTMPRVNYKDIWLGTIPDESEAVIARSSNGGVWEGYNYSNAATDMIRNILAPAHTLDSLGSYTGVQNGRIGIRCVENPKGVSITNITAFAADIEWQPVFNPIGYQVIVKLDKKYPTNAEWAASNKPTTNSLALSGLTEDTKYYVFIRSICGAKDTSGFTIDSFTTLITCHTPIITISGLNGTRAVASWQTVKTAYKYEYAMSKSATPPAVGTDINKTSMLAPFLDEGTEYYVHVRSHCSSIYDKSDWATAKFNTWAVNVNNVNGEGAQLAVYPNPVQQEMVITIGGTVQEGTITVLDMTGKLLKTQTVNSNTAKVNVTELPAGMYIVQYTDDNRREQVKFSKQ
jgi:hypothetical protein